MTKSNHINYVSTINRIAGKSPIAIKIETPSKPMTETEKTEEVKRIADRPNHFADTLRAYETAAINNADVYGDHLLNLAYAVTLSVLRKLRNVGGEVRPNAKGEYKNPKGGAYSALINGLMIDLRRDRADLERIAYATEHATERRTRINRDGEEVTETVIINSDCNTAARKLAADTLSDGSDLVNTAVVAIMDETAKARDRAAVNGQLLEIGFMEVPYTHRVCKTHVIINNAIAEWESVTITPIQQAFRAVRRAVERTRAVTNASNKYTYLDIVTIDDETGDSAVITRRLPMYSNLAGEITDISGKVVYITADADAVDRVDSIINSLSLTDRQAQVIRLRMSGYSLDDVSKVMGISKSHVQRTLKQIQPKLIAIGIQPKGEPIKKQTAPIIPADKIDNIALSLNLTDREVSMLKLRSTGIGYGSIAKILDMTKSQVQHTLQSINNRCIGCL